MANTREDATQKILHILIQCFYIYYCNRYYPAFREVDWLKLHDIWFTSVSFLCAGSSESPISKYNWLCVSVVDLLQIMLVCHRVLKIEILVCYNRALNKPWEWVTDVVFSQPSGAVWETVSWIRLHNPHTLILMVKGSLVLWFQSLSHFTNIIILAI